MRMRHVHLPFAGIVAMFLAGVAGCASVYRTTPGSLTGMGYKGADAIPLEQIIKQLNKLLHVLKIVELDPRSTVERELVLIKVAADVSCRSDVLEIVRMFRVRVVDVNPESLTIEATGSEDKIEALLGLLEHYGVIELVRSGAVAVTRGPKALSEKVLGSEITGR